MGELIADVCIGYDCLANTDFKAEICLKKGMTNDRGNSGGHNRLNI